MRDPDLVLRGRPVVKGTARGEALVSPEPICFLGGVDVQTGCITEKGHPLEGRSIAGKVLVFPVGKGSTGGSYLIYEAASNGVGPMAVVNRRAEVVTTIGCVIADIPMVDEVDPDPVEAIASGDLVEVRAEEGVILVWKQGKD